jgi:nitroreductase
MNKFIVVFCLVLTLCASTIAAQGNDNPAYKIIVNHFAWRNFAPTAPTKAEIDQVIQAGIRAPSARNDQPWYFTVVQDQNLAKRILPQTSDGNALIIVSAAGDGKTNGTVILDCGLAGQSMYLAAQAIGLGSRIYTNPIEAINKSFKKELGIPDNHNAVALIRIGKVPAGVDAVSSASARKNAAQLVTWR